MAFLWQGLPEQISTWTCILATEWMIVHLSLRQFSHIKLRMTYTYGESGVLYIYMVKPMEHQALKATSWHLVII